ncbi:MAG: hydroxyacylglutathione hydrolase [Lysobacteraceae bacterium]
MRLLALPAFDDNYIWALVGDDGRALFVDPGDAGPVLTAAAEGLQPIGILITHHHPDHIGGLEQLQRRWPDLAIHAPHDARIGIATHRVGDGGLVEVGDWRFDVLEIPGHTRSHIAFHSESIDDGHDGALLFCGDTLFSLGCGRLFEGTPTQMLGSLDRLAALPGDTRVCCTHEYTLGNAAFASMVDPDNTALRERVAAVRTLRAASKPTLPSTIALESATNPFLRCDSPAVRAAIATRLGRMPADRIETFAELRRWKDVFRS